MILLTMVNSKDINAGSKAQNDIKTILENKYKGLIESRMIYFDKEEKQKNNLFIKVKNTIHKIFLLRKANRKDDYKIIQYPISSQVWLMNFIKKENTIVFIHDLIGLRSRNRKIINKEMKMLEDMAVIVAHNEKMRDFLIAERKKKKKIYSLELFDYLIDDGKIKKRSPELIVDYAGNLKRIKAPFIYELNEDKMGFILNLYGNGLEEIGNSKIKAKGTFPSEQLPFNLSGNLGLIWDGELDDSDGDEGFKKYGKYINPHKLSCYISAELPVIVWEKAGYAKFVVDNGIGYTINNLYEINDIDLTTYNEKVNNIKKLKKKIIEGNYTETVFNKIIKDINKN